MYTNHLLRILGVVQLNQNLITEEHVINVEQKIIAIPFFEKYKSIIFFALLLITPFLKKYVTEFLTDYKFFPEINNSLFDDDDDDDEVKNSIRNKLLTYLMK